MKRLNQLVKTAYRFLSIFIHMTRINNANQSKSEVKILTGITVLDETVLRLSSLVCQMIPRGIFPRYSGKYLIV